MAKGFTGDLSQYPSEALPSLGFFPGFSVRVGLAKLLGSLGKGRGPGGFCSSTVWPRQGFHTPRAPSQLSYLPWGICSCPCTTFIAGCRQLRRPGTCLS